MKVFISDLHLGDGSRTDDFHRDKELLKFLEFVESQAKELVILGDFLELWQADLDRVLFSHSEVINRLLGLRNNIKVTYVVGNHDYIPFAKFAESDIGISLEYKDQEAGIVAEHGHKYDIFNRYKNPLKSIKWPPGKYFTKVVAGLERLIHPDIDVWARRAMENLDGFLQQAISVRNKVPPASKEYIKRGGHFVEFEEAVKGLVRQGAKIVIFGHTHQCQIKNFDGGAYANCGSWVDGSTPTYITHDKGKIELKEALTHKVIEGLEIG